MTPPRGFPRAAILGLALAAAPAAGCNDPTPAQGEQAVLPADYKEKEKAIMDGFKKSLAPKGKSQAGR